MRILLFFFFFCHLQSSYRLWNAIFHKKKCVKSHWFLFQWKLHFAFNGNDSVNQIESWDILSLNGSFKNIISSFFPYTEPPLTHLKNTEVEGTYWKKKRIPNKCIFLYKLWPWVLAQNLNLKSISDVPIENHRILNKVSWLVVRRNSAALEIRSDQIISMWLSLRLHWDPLKL